MSQNWSELRESSCHHWLWNTRRPVKSQFLPHHREFGCTHFTYMRHKPLHVGRSFATTSQQWTDRHYIQVSDAGCRLGKEGEQPGVGTGVLL